MEQHRNSGSSLLSTIMGPSGVPIAKVRQTGKPVTAGDVQDIRTSAKNLAAERSAASIRKGPQVPRGGGSYGRAVRRQRKAGRTKRVEKVQAQTKKLQQQRERVLDTAAAFARIWFAGPPTAEKKVGVSAYDRVRQRVYKQAEGLVESGKASSWEDAVEQIETSMRETTRQHDVLQASKLMAKNPPTYLRDKQAQIDALKKTQLERYDPRTGNSTMYVEGTG